MSVLIKGMMMPKAGDWKTIRVYYDGTCAEPNWQGDCKVMQGCEAVLIPDHGDLIDRDAFRKTMYHDAFETDSDMQKWESGCWIRYKMFERNIESAPVVIPAERSEDGET